MSRTLAESRREAYFSASPSGVRVVKSREPILNVPAVVLVLLVLIGLVHAARVYVLTDETDRALIWTIAFVPARYSAAMVNEGLLPGGFAAQVWTFVTYAFIHADITHLGVNAIWLLAFGSPVARRMGPARFLAFFVVTVAGGALAHLVTHAAELSPMVGASAAISGTMGAATRFVFEHGGPLDMWRPADADPDCVPAAPLRVALRNPRVLIFLGVWFGLNLLFGLEIGRAHV